MMITNELLSQLTSSAIVIYALEALKQSAWVPWITVDTRRLNRWLAVVGSGAAALGIHFVFDVEAGQIIISGLTPSGIAHGLWHWAEQYALTQLAYDAAVAPKK